MNKINKMITIEELYSFAGVEKGCKTKELINALNDKLNNSISTKEEENFLYGIKESLDIYNNINRKNKETINKYKNIDYKKILDEQEDVLVVSTGVEDEYTDEVLVLVNRRTDNVKEQVNNKLYKKYKYILIPLSLLLFLLISSEIILDKKIEENKKSDMPKLIYDENINYGDNEIIKLEECYTIKEGDTLYNIANEKNVDIKDIRYKDEKKEIVPELIFPEEEIIITHRVNSELLEENVLPVEFKSNSINYSGFAKMFDTTEETIYKLNKEAVYYDEIKEKYIITSDKLYVPVFNTIIKEKQKVKKLN